MSRRLGFSAVVLFFLATGFTSAQAQSPFAYISPLPNSKYIPAGTTIVMQPGEALDETSVMRAGFQVRGAHSGVHAGQLLLAADQQTIIFKPAQSFSPEETVSVTLAKGLRTKSGRDLDGLSFNFTIAATAHTRDVRQFPATFESAGSTLTTHAPIATRLAQGYITLPADFPIFGVTTPANGASDGYLFLANFRVPVAPHSYALIVDNTGQPIYYRQMPVDTRAVDFKLQPNGLLTYGEGVAYIGGTIGLYRVMDTSYNIVDTIQAGNGYTADLHDLQLLPNGNALLLIFDAQTIDMSGMVPGGNPAATVIGLVIQELDAAQNVVFQWRSWDHFQLTDTYEPLTAAVINYVHGNAIELDTDGNLLISSRHMNEITKISRQSGAIIWRLGGKNNQFTFLNDNQQFYHQHDIRRLPNGHLTLFDNRNDQTPAYSRAVEYQLDETNKTATLVWQYRNTPDIYSAFMGNAQRLSNGNTLIGWGAAYPSLIEVKPDGAIAFELSFAEPQVSYRALRFLWHGYPTTDPTLVAQTSGPTTTLTYSWNGATDIVAYKIYGGDRLYPSNLMATQTRTGFETQTVLTNVQNQYCYFRVMPVDAEGRETRYSNEAYSGMPCRYHSYLPLAMK